MGEPLDLDALPLRERDKMVSQVMHFLIDRGYHIYAPTLDGYARVGEQPEARPNIPPGVTAAQWDEHCAKQADPGTCDCSPCIGR